MDRRLAILREISEGKLSVSSAARKYGLHRNSLYRWREQLGMVGWQVNDGLKDVLVRSDDSPTAHNSGHRPVARVGTRPVQRLENEEALIEVPDPRWADELPEVAVKSLDDFGLFRSHYIGRESAPWAVEAAHKLLELYHSDEEEYLVLNVAPGAGKTTLVTHDFVVWVIARERALGYEPTISLGHRTTNKALWYVGRVASTLQHNQRLQADFGRFKPGKARSVWSREELMVEPHSWTQITEKEPTVSAAAYDASILSGRYRLVIWDDLVDKANSSTAEAREKLVQWWDQEAESRLNTGGLIVLSGARYGPEDLFHHAVTQVDILDEDEDGEPRRLYERIVYPAHFDDKCDGQTHEGPWPQGCLLDPERVSAKKVRRYQAKDEGRYRLVWQQEDVDPKGFLADPIWFTGGTDRQGRMVPGCLDDMRRFGEIRNEQAVVNAITLDPSPQRYWAIQHWMVYEDRTQELTRAMRRMLQAPEVLYRENDGSYSGVLEEWWRASLAAGQPYTWLVAEVNTANRWLLQYPFVLEWCAARNVTIVRHTTGVNKLDPERGVEGLGPVYREGRARLPYGGYEEKTYADQFVREATTWPEGSTDDQVMAHWFLNAKLDAMWITMASEDVDGVSGVPTWVYGAGASVGGAPKWATRGLATPVTIHS